MSLIPHRFIKPPPIPRGRPWLKIITLIALALVFSIVATLTAISFRSHHDWAETKRELESKGEKLSLRELLPPPVPDEQNFYNDPLWAEVAEQKTETPEGKVIWTPVVPEEKQQLGGLLSRSLSAAEIATLKKAYPALASLDLSPAPKAFLETGWLHAKDHDEAWKTELARLTLEVLKPSEPVLARITELSKRPGAYFPSNYEDGFSAVIPQVSPRILLHHAFWLRVQAEIQAGEGQLALADLEAMLALSRLAFLDFGLPSQLIGTSQLTRTLGVVALGLQAHLWTDDQLHVLEGALGQVDLLAGLIRSVRNERASANALMDQVASGQTASIASTTNETGVPKAFHRALTKGYLSIWGPADQAYANRLDQRVIDLAKVSDWNGLRSNSFDEDFVNPTKAFQLTHIFSELTTPAWSALFTVTSAAQTRLVQARIACALERYFLSHRAYPPTLAELVPSYLPSIPPDIFSGQPMHYEKISSDGFKLWSDGWDGKDDQGQPSARSKLKVGDWVWGAAL